MKKIIILIALILMVSACSTTTDPIITNAPLEQYKIPTLSEAQKTELEILQITQGKMRKLGDEYVIYERSDDMEYEENDRCMYNKESINCLRHGFKIKYNSYNKDFILQCTAKTNIAVNAGNVAHEKYVNTTEDDFYIDLKASENEFINVQYISGQPGLEDLQIETSCSHEGREVFQLKQRVRFGV